MAPLPSLPAALSAADRGGFKTVRQLMDPVIEEMQEAAAGEDDGMLIKAVGVVLCQALPTKIAEKGLVAAWEAGS